MEKDHVTESKNRVVSLDISMVDYINQEIRVMNQIGADESNSVFETKDLIFEIIVKSKKVRKNIKRY